MPGSHDQPYPRLAIACQGGGAITAFQAGVLGRLLAAARVEAGQVLIDMRDLAHPDLPRTYRLVALSGTSGGAMNAAACWVACAEGKPNKARDRLWGFWQANVAHFYDPSLMGLWFNAFQRLSTQLTAGWWQTDFDPELWPLARWAQGRFGDIISEHIGIDDARPGIDHAPALYVGSAEIRSGSFAVFARNAPRRTWDEAGPVTVEALGASGAVPWIYPAVKMPLARWQLAAIADAAGRRAAEGDPDTNAEWRQAREDPEGAYWDGLFSQNPPLWPLVKGQEVGIKPQDILVLRANPRVIPQAPHSPAEVSDRRNELEGNLSLEQEIVAIDAINKCVARAGAALADSYHTLRVWELDLPWKLHRHLRTTDKMRRDAPFIDGLFSAGAELATRFLDGAIGADERTGR